MFPRNCDLNTTGGVGLRRTALYNPRRNVIRVCVFRRDSQHSQAHFPADAFRGRGEGEPQDERRWEGQERRNEEAFFFSPNATGILCISYLRRSHDPHRGTRGLAGRPADRPSEWMNGWLTSIATFHLAFPLPPCPSLCVCLSGCQAH